jgi:methylglutaconyl-CoA hydratase
MNYTTIAYRTDDRVAIVTMNRPERRNSLDDVMIRELTDVFTTINRTNGTRVVVLTGEGASFCAGMDLDYLQRFSAKGEQENLEDARNLSKMLQLIHTLKKPVIAAVNGPALGGGCGIAAACDFVFAAKDATKIGAPEVRLGFLPAVILIYLVKRMGVARAREFVLMGGVLSADAAKGTGLVTDVVPDDQLEAHVMTFARTLASTTSPSSVCLTKDLFARMDEMSPKEALEYAASLNALTRKTDDFRRGVESFLKKEKLSW